MKLRLSILSRLWIYSVAFLALLATLSSSVSAQQYSAVTENGLGAIATVNPRATAAALEAFSKGGNAIDAAVTAALTLGVVDGFNSGIGGGCFILIHWADGRIEAIDGREIAPAAAHRDMYLRNGVADPKLSKIGALAIGIPGSLAAYDYLLKSGGKLGMSNALARGIELAGEGFAIDPVYANRLSWVAERIRQFPAAARILLDSKGQPWSAGDRLVQQDLAETYRSISKLGIDYFYRGGFATAIESWMKEHGGIITAADFNAYQLQFHQALTSQYRGYTVVGYPPPSSGGVHVAQILNMLEQFDLASLSAIDRHHLLAETMKLAFADRAYWLGDPAFAKVPRGIIDPGYAKRLAAGIDMQKANVVAGQGNPPRSDIDFFGKHTTHIAAADKDGNWVAITTTVNTTFGSKVIIPGTGVVMNNQMDDFSIQPGVPNAYGLVGIEANSIAPGKRPLSSMTPTILLKDKQPIMTLGAAGGPTIITQVAQALINTIDLNMSLAEALAALRVHHQWKPDILLTEASMSEAEKKQLTAKGHTIKVRSYMGATQGIKLNAKGEFVAVSEPRIIAKNSGH